VQEPKLETSANQQLCTLGGVASGGESLTTTNDVTVSHSDQQHEAGANGDADTNHKVCLIMQIMQRCEFITKLCDAFCELTFAEACCCRREQQAVRDVPQLNNNNNNTQDNVYSAVIMT